MRQAFAQSSAPSKSKRADEPDEDDSPTKKIRQAEPKNMPKQKAKGRGRGTGRGVSNEQVLQSLTRLSINHEDSLNTLQQELSWVMYLTTGELSILPNIYAEKSKDASKLSTPFRTRAMRVVLEQTLERVEQIQTKEEVLVDAEKEGWVVRVKDTEAPAFVYQQWSSEQDKTVHDTARRAVPADDVVQLLKTCLEELAQHPQLISRLMPSRPIAEKMTGGPVRVHIQVQLQHLKGKFHQALSGLTDNAVWAAIEGSLRPGSVQRSPAAKSLAKQASGSS